MTKLLNIVLVIVILAIVSATGGFFYFYNSNQQLAQQRAMTSLDQGIALFREKKYSESLETLQGIPDGAIEDWHLPYYTGSAHVMLKDFEAAVEELEEARALNPREPLILFELGVIYYKLGNIGLSKAFFESVVAIDPTNDDARGLMDIMANLERQIANGESPDAAPQPKH